MRWNLPARIIAAGALSVLAGVAGAQTLTYTLLRPGEAQPSPRFDGTIAYDAASRQIFLFGGQDTAPLNDVWAYSLAERRWTEMRVAGARPPARFGHTMVFDPVRRRLVVFGGQARGFFSDTWAFDIAAAEWRQLSPDQAGPSRRYGHSAIYETARDRMVISHGFTDDGRFDDTWAFDFRSNSWRDLSPSGGRPLRRCLHESVYDPAGGRMFLYGGCASGFGPCPLGDLWSFDLSMNRWTELSPRSSPPPREHYGIALDAVRGRIVLFGGSGGGLLNDTWEYDLRAGVWQPSELSGQPPEPRQRHETAYVSDRNTIVFFGGVTPSGQTNELWLLGPGFLADTPRVAESGIVNALSGTFGAVAPGEVVSIYGDRLGPSDGVASALDPLTRSLPTASAGVTVTWNEVPAPLFYVSSGQLNVQVPYELADAGTATVVVTVNGATGSVVSIPVVPSQPGLFPWIFNQDGSLNTPDNAAAPGSTVVMYATGQGMTNPPSRTGAAAIDLYPEPAAPVDVQIGGRPAAVDFKGLAPGTVGVLQINARIPEGLAPGALPLVVLIGGTASQPGVTVSVR